MFGEILTIIAYAFHFSEKLPVDTLDMFAQMPMFIDGLSADTKSKLIHSKQLVEKLSHLPTSSFLSVVVNNWDFLTTLPKNMVIYLRLNDLGTSKHRHLLYFRITQQGLWWLS